MLIIRQKMQFNNERVLTIKEMAYYLELDQELLGKYVGLVKKNMQFHKHFYKLEGGRLAAFKSKHKIEYQIGSTINIFNQRGFGLIADRVVQSHINLLPNVKATLIEYFDASEEFVENYFNKEYYGNHIDDPMLDNDDLLLNEDEELLLNIDIDDKKQEISQEILDWIDEFDWDPNI